VSKLAADLAAALDPVQLATRLEHPPDPWQARLLRSTSPRLLLNCARQSGKSTMTAVLALHTAIYEPGSLVLMIAPSQRQSVELFHKASVFYRQLGRPVAAATENLSSLTLENGSRVISLPGDGTTIRGYSRVRLLLIDEASRVADETYFSVRPMVAIGGGRIILMSTPSGKRGFFYEACEHDAASTWERFTVPATACPRISAAVLAEEEAIHGAWSFRQEYCNEFIDDETQLFAENLVRSAFRPEVLPLWQDEAGAA
jgi:hypothetical protein